MYQSKDEHLIPLPVLDIGNKLKASKHVNETANLRLRIEKIKEYCEFILKQGK